jgi:taurine dioxygenase/pentalenolactone F synthase
VRLKITGLHASFGGEVRGWDPSVSFTPDEVDALHDALGRFALLLFRGQRSPDNEELLRFAGSFGELHRGAESAAQEGGDDPYVLRIENDPEQDAAGVAGASSMPWHSDYTFKERPAKETILEAMVLPDSGGDTSFCNMYRAWDALDPALRDELVDRNAWHRLDTYQAVREAEEENAGPQGGRRAELGTPEPETDAWHPVAYVHPEFAKTALYLNKFVYQIDGMSPSESQQLRDELLDAASTADNVYRHMWCVGDLVVFDQIGTVHRRETFDSGQARLMRQLSTILPNRSASAAV